MAFRLIKYMEQREEHDVFPAYCRANTRGRLSGLAKQAGLAPEAIVLLPRRPLFYFFAPIAALELIVSRALIWLGFEEFATSVMLGVLRRGSQHSASERVG